MKHVIFSITFILTLAGIISACTNGGSVQTQEGERLGHWVVSLWIDPLPDRPVFMVIREKNGERRVLLHDGDREERLLGAMTQGLGRDVPLETFFVQVEETRFIVFWPAEEIANKARSVHVYAPDPLHPDLAKSTVLKAVVLDKEGMGVMPILPNERDAWSHLTGVIIYPHDFNADPLVDIVFDPPLPIESRFKQIWLTRISGGDILGGLRIALGALSF